PPIWSSFKVHPIRKTTDPEDPDLLIAVSTCRYAERRMSRRVWASASWFVVLLVPVRGISPLAIYPPNPNGASPPHLGRTTFVNTLCGKHVLSHKDADDAANAH